MKTVWAALLLLAAMLFRVLPIGHFDLAWRVDEYTHRGISLNALIFWILLLAAALLFTIAIIQRLRASVA
jgi:hypothetical protein